MFNKLLQTVLNRRSLSALKCIRTNKSSTLYRRFNNYNHKLVITSNFSCYTQIKCKYKDSSKKSMNKPEDSDNEDDVENIEDLEETGKKIVTVSAKAMRLDAIVKAGFGISRNKVEQAFYSSKIRKNGKKVTKKSELIYEGDEIDLIHSTSPTNSDLLVVSRILVLKLSSNNEVYKIKLARDKNVTVENKVDEE